MEYHDGGPLTHMGDLPTMAAERYGEKTAIVSFAQEHSYADLERESNQMANVLTDAGVGPRDRVGLYLPNTFKFASAYFGTLKVGAVAVPLNLRMDAETLAYVVKDAGIDTMIGTPLLADDATELAKKAEIGTTFLPGVSEHSIVDLSGALSAASTEFTRPEREPGAIACQPYTSGTTGQPKGVLLTHENLLTTIESYQTGLAIGPDDSILLVLPLFHIYALNAVMGTYLASGAKMVLQAIPDARNMLTAISQYELTQFAGVPAIYTMMFREYREAPENYDLSSLKNAVCAAAPLADATRREIEEEWDLALLEGWGMTETAPAGTLEPHRGVRKSASCIGPPVPNIELKLVDPDTRETIVASEDITPNPNPEIDFDDEVRVTGEIAVRGPQVFEGYYNAQEKTRAAFSDDGWFYTEDIARVDEDGYFWMVDRADDMMIVGGENVYPAEIEDALYAHPDVAEASVIAADHELKGQAPVAFVVRESVVDEDEEEEREVPDLAVSDIEVQEIEDEEEQLRRFALEHVPTYAHPRRVFFVEELPRSATQKVQRFKLEERAASQLDGPLTSTDKL